MEGRPASNTTTPEPRRERRHPEVAADLALTTHDLIRRRKLWPLEEDIHLLGVTRPTLYRWEAAGYLQFTRRRRPHLRG